MCPICQTPRSGRFCEVDGHDFESPLPDPIAPALWEAVVGADRAYFDEVIALNGPDARAMVFPPYCPERAYPMIGKQVRIGRASRTRGTAPEIDLGLPPADPGISHLHAVLMAQPDGAWTLVDPGSANGTRVNGKPLQVNVPVPVAEGDTIHLGAWTVITLRASGS
ncbi:FHA domain-containing protein [Nonomuraea sp. NPDC049152]|uniref:FHA domain-containing protein n=1 Tax=Nonomuraea sp. NPDC049152 TaxID=3154350 RepID=UPI0033C7D7A1